MTTRAAGPKDVPGPDEEFGAIALGSDEAGLELKDAIAGYLRDAGIDFVDYGVHDKTPVLYPDIAVKVARAVAEERHARAILICGTGIGMAITANKVPGVRAAVCHDPYSAERARKSNDCQIMTLGSRVVAPALAWTLVKIWLESEFEGGRSMPKVRRISDIERGEGQEPDCSFGPSPLPSPI
jgi:ribose 5-phosphate isomerase B